MRGALGLVLLLPAARDFLASPILEVDGLGEDC